MTLGASRASAWACILVGLTSFNPGAAAASDLRDLCPTRPGLGTAPCIVDAGHVLVEVGLGDWTIESDSETRTDTVLIGDLLVRYGLSNVDELQLGWTPFGHVRQRDKSTGSVVRAGGVGDVTVAYKHSLRHPDGNGLSVAIQPFVTLPVGGSAIGNHDWSTGLLVPISFDVTDHLQLQATPEVDAAVDGDGHGRHASFGGVAGLAIAISKQTGVSVEISAFQDQDPAGQATKLLAGVSATFQPNENLQLDVGGAFGLNRASPDAELSVGVSGRF